MKAKVLLALSLISCNLYSKNYYVSAENTHIGNLVNSNEASDNFHILGKITGDLYADNPNSNHIDLYPGSTLQGRLFTGAVSVANIQGKINGTDSITTFVDNFRIRLKGGSINATNIDSSNGTVELLSGRIGENAGNSFIIGNTAVNNTLSIRTNKFEDLSIRGNITSTNFTPHSNKVEIVGPFRFGGQLQAVDVEIKPSGIFALNNDTVSAPIVNNGMLILEKPTAGNVIRIGGNYTQSADAVLVSSFTNGQLDGQLFVVDNADFNNGKILVRLNDGMPVAGTIPLVRSANYINNPPTEIISSSALVSFRIVPHNRHVDAEPIRTPIYALSSDTTSDTYKLGHIVEGWRASGTYQPLLAILDTLPTKEMVERALHNLHAPVHDGPTNIFHRDADEIANIVDRRLEAVAAGDDITRKELWVKGLHRNGKQRDIGVYSGYNSHSNNIIFGGEKEINYRLTLGLTGAFGKTSLNANDSTAGSSYRISSYQAGIYGSYDYGCCFVDGISLYSYHRNRTRRTSNVFTGIASAAYNGNQLSTKFRVGKRFKHNDFILSPNVGLQHTYVHHSKYSETSSGTIPALLDVKTKPSSAVRVGIGGSIMWRKFERGYKFIPEAHANYYRSVKNIRNKTTQRYIGGNTVETEGLSPEKSMFNLGVGLEFDVAERHSLNITYDADFRHGYRGKIAAIKWSTVF